MKNPKLEYQKNNEFIFENKFYFRELLLNSLETEMLSQNELQSQRLNRYSQQMLIDFNNLGDTEQEE